MSTSLINHTLTLTSNLTPRLFIMSLPILKRRNLLPILPRPLLLAPEFFIVKEDLRLPLKLLKHITSPPLRARLLAKISSRRASG